MLVLKAFYHKYSPPVSLANTVNTVNIDSKGQPINLLCMTKEELGYSSTFVLLLSFGGCVGILQ